MSTLRETFTDIAEAIRDKDSRVGQLKPTQMAAAIENIPSGEADTSLEDFINDADTTVTYNGSIITGSGNFYGKNKLKVLAPNATALNAYSFLRTSFDFMKNFNNGDYSNITTFYRNPFDNTSGSKATIEKAKDPTATDTYFVFNNLDTIIYNREFFGSDTSSGPLRLFDATAYSPTNAALYKDYDKYTHPIAIFPKKVEVKDENLAGNRTNTTSFQFTIGTSTALKAVIAKETRFRITTDGAGSSSINSLGSMYCVKTIDINGWDGWYTGTSTSSSYFIFGANAYNLRDVIIRRTDMVQPVAPNRPDGNIFGANCYFMNGTVNASYNPNGEKGNIWVPDELVDSYKAAQGWSTYADQIKPLSQYVDPYENY